MRVFYKNEMITNDLVDERFNVILEKLTNHFREELQPLKKRIEKHPEHTITIVANGKKSGLGIKGIKDKVLMRDILATFLGLEKPTL